MKIFLSENCVDIHGKIGNTGYHVRRSKNTWYLRRNPNGYVPSDGHLSAIIRVASIAGGFHVKDISIGWLELQEALFEAHRFQAAEHVRRNYIQGPRKASYNARDIINLKHTFGL